MLSQETKTIFHAESFKFMPVVEVANEFMLMLIPLIMTFHVLFQFFPTY